MDLRFETDAGPLMLKNVKCWVSSGDLPANVGDILLSRAIMYKLGFDPRAMLREAASVTDAIDMADAVSHSGIVQAVLAVSHELVDDLAEEEEDLVPLEMNSCFPDMAAVDAASETAKIKVVLDAKVNVWADQLSRWGSTLPSICAIKQQPLLISPLRDDKFVWPTFVSIAEAQVAVPDDVLSGMAKSKDAAHLAVLASGQSWPLRLVDNVIWVPAAAELQLRLCVCAHASLAGHRTATATLSSLESFCQWTGMKDDVEFFVRRCLHCASASGGAPRPIGEALHSTMPNGLIHWDFVFMGASKTGDKYLLVVKCDTSKMVWLFPAPEATATFVKDCLLQWFAVFGVCYEWVSDQGTHFKNQVIAGSSMCWGLTTTSRLPAARGRTAQWKL
ncbi:Aste57867_23606 [Aphanomyces stellatus]|uniref:Aste57867_23606 protein n=1 Tax=Aphanomyces stellatus TaxID=120398 RepID=A0A485LNI3_9STRA|nr:hypothetical protein As57867_023534 [Aphanomyces stellatus]VFU00251.1 Aste57867_23606 [Aphanomyces stellatus]